MKHPETRNTIFHELATVIDHNSFPANQYHLRLQAPLTASHAQPGSFVYLQCDPILPMRRPMSIMLVNTQQQAIDILYKVQGEGTAILAKKETGATLDLLGPIGQPFKLSGYRKRPLLIGGGVGIPPMVFLAEHIKNSTKNIYPLVLMGSEVPFPFKTKPSQIMLPDMPAEVIACMPLLDDWGIPSRLSSLQDYNGCFNGYITDLARAWLDSLEKDQLDEIEIFSCGPTPMLKAIAKLAQEYNLPCQISLEEYMACAVGGCAGCAVLVQTESGPAMKRVCVDGPVFEASAVYPA